jgi:hypothetical protein
MRARGATACLLVLVAACATGSPPLRPAPPTTTVVRTAACAARTPFGTDRGANEVKARTTTGQAWGLTVEGSLPPRPGERVKIVWRVTGHGPLHVEFTGPDGKPQPLTFGPEQHASSTYHRPGEEWGTGFRFTSRGCWRIHLARDDTVGDVWIAV